MDITDDSNSDNNDNNNNGSGTNSDDGIPTVPVLLDVWNEKFRNNELDMNSFIQYWIVTVPDVYKVPTNSKCVNWTPDEMPTNSKCPTREAKPLNWTPSEKEIQEKLLNPLEYFMSNNKKPDEFIEEVVKSCRPSSICGSVFKMSEPTYNCRECSADPTCVLCVHCFMNSEHRFHKYKMSTSSGGGCCDCGDVEAWRNYPHCDVHKAGIAPARIPNIDNNRNDAEMVMETDDNTDVLITAETNERCCLIFAYVLNYAYEILSTEHVPDLPKKYRLYLYDEEMSATDTFCTVLYNDESHTFENVINTLQKVMRIDNKEAVEYVTNIDRVGRSVVKSSNFQVCDDLKDDIERITSRNSGNPLKVSVVHTDVIAHQMFAIRLLNWLRRLLCYCRYFRDVFAKVTTVSRDGRCLIESILLRDCSLWKMARVQWHRLLITGLMMEYDNKKRFAELFTRHYGSIMKDFVKDDHEHTVSIASMGVQLYTVPSIARYLIGEMNGLFVVFNSFLAECNPFLRGSKLEFQRNIPATTFKRAQFTLYDVHYLLTNVPTEWTDKLRQGFLQGFTAFLRLLSYMQDMDAVVRQVGQHMEYEPEWETAFNLHMRLTSVITSVLKWCGSDRQVLIKSFRLTSKKLRDHFAATWDGQHELRDLAGRTALSILYDVGFKPVSIHLPLNRFLSGLYLYFERYRLDYHSKELGPEPKLDPEQLAEYVLRAQVMIAQVHAGLWRRNGYSILHQIYFYHNVKCRAEMLDQDIVALQITASLSDHNVFLLRMLNKYKLIHWADANFEEQVFKKTEDDTTRHMITLVEEFLLLLIHVVTERYKVGVGRVSLNDCVRKEIIQQLCVKPLSHSELNRELPDETGHHDTGLDRVINDVAIFKKPSNNNGSGKGMYELKEHYYEQYNVFYYHYSKEELSKAEEVQRKRRKQLGLSECCPPPVLPQLAGLFHPLSGLLQCDVTLYVLGIVLSRALDLHARSFSEAQLHRALHLINCGFLEEETGYYAYLNFTERFQRRGLMYILENLLRSNRVEAYKDYIKWTLNKYHQLCAIVSVRKTGITRSINDLTSDNNNSNNNQNNSSSNNNNSNNDNHALGDRRVVVVVDEDDDKQRRAKIASERRAKIMAQMAAMQRSFIKENQQLLDATSNSSNTTTPASTPTGSRTTFDKDDDVPVAIGLAQSRRPFLNEIVTCILCQEEEEIRLDGVSMVYGAFVQKSSVLMLKNCACIDILFLSSLFSPATYISTCGHVMHSVCWKKYFANIVTKEARRPYRSRQTTSYDVDKKEFLCPLCETLCNTALPILPALDGIGEPLKIQKDDLTDLPYDFWLQSHLAILLQQRQQQQESSSDDYFAKQLFRDEKVREETVLKRFSSLIDIVDENDSIDTNMNTSSVANTVVNTTTTVSVTTATTTTTILNTNALTTLTVITSTGTNTTNANNDANANSIINNNNNNNTDETRTPAERENTIIWTGNLFDVSMEDAFDLEDEDASEMDEPANEQMAEDNIEDSDNLNNLTIDDGNMEDNSIIVNDGNIVEVRLTLSSDDDNAFANKNDNDDNNVLRMSRTNVQMMDQLSITVFTKSVKGNSYNKSDGLLFMWRCCSYTIHAVERQLRSDEAKSILGDLNNRQRACLESIVRMCALNVKYKSRNYTYKLCNMLLGIVFGMTRRPNATVTHYDAFSMLVSLTMSLPAFYSEDPRVLPSGCAIDVYILRLLFAVATAQIICGHLLPKDVFFPVARSSVDDDGDDNDEQQQSDKNVNDDNNKKKRRKINNNNNNTNDNYYKTEQQRDEHRKTSNLQKLYEILRKDDLTMKLPHSDYVNTIALWNHVKRSIVPFLRCSALFYHFLTRIEPDECLKMPGGDTFENLCRYLGLSTECHDFITPTILRLCGRWRKNEHYNDKTVTILEDVYLPRVRLITLPENYSTLINLVSDFHCSNSTHEDSRNPTMCLVCGEMLCSQSYCCQITSNGNTYGACTSHAYQCGKGAGIFLRIRECEILLLSFPNRGCFLPAPYVDEYGETDQNLRRGNPLKLCETRYKKLLQMWLNHTVHEEVTRSLESAHTVPITPWHNL